LSLLAVAVVAQAETITETAWAVAVLAVYLLLKDTL
jgi:hypothetical protein